MVGLRDWISSFNKLKTVLSSQKAHKNLKDTSGFLQNCCFFVQEFEIITLSFASLTKA